MVLVLKKMQLSGQLMLDRKFLMLWIELLKNAEHRLPLYRLKVCLQAVREPKRWQLKKDGDIAMKKLYDLLEAVI